MVWKESLINELYFKMCNKMSSTFLVEKGRIAKLDQKRDECVRTLLMGVTYF